MNKPDFSLIEKEQLLYWKDINAENQAIIKTRRYPKFIFDDLLFSRYHDSIKDIIYKYKSQTGYYVSRKWNWSKEHAIGTDSYSSIQLTILIPLWNCIKLLNENVNDPELVSAPKSTKLDNVMDHWILQKLETLVVLYHIDMNNYKLDNLSEMVKQFIGNLYEKYINMNKSRIITDNKDALGTVFYCLKILSFLLAPLTPFFSEWCYRNLRKISSFECIEKSVHLCQIPQHVWYINTEFISSVNDMFSIIDAISSLKASNQLRKLTIHKLDTTKNNNNLCALKQYMIDYLNIGIINIKHSPPKKIKDNSAVSISTMDNRYLLIVDTTMTENMSFMKEARVLVSFINKAKKKLVQKKVDIEIHYNISGSMRDTTASSLTKCNRLLTIKQDEYIFPLLRKKIWKYDPGNDESYFFREHVNLFNVSVEILFKSPLLVDNRVNNENEHYVKDEINIELNVSSHKKN
jgi:isoleucyl-tRNA synthetase